jgi:RNA polymerase sigma factor (sigma-70 family)
MKKISEDDIKKIMKICGPLITKKYRYYKNTILSREDLINEAVLEILQKIHRWNPKKSDLKVFLDNIILNRFKELKRKNNTIIDIRNRITYSPEENIIFSETLKIHDDPRGIGYKYFVEEKTYKEISDEIGISIGTISKIINKIRKKMEKEYRD